MKQDHNDGVLDPSSHVNVSVLICTRNRAESLRSVIARWAMIKSLVSWELVIVDNGSSDNTENVIKECIEKFSINIVYKLEPKRGLSRARNCAIKNSSGEIILFTDDDCYPDDGIIENLIVALDEDNLDYVGGMIGLYDKRDAKITIKTDKEKAIFAKKTYITPGMIHGACIVFKRNVFRCVGDFNVSLGAGTIIGSGEDSELICRASMAGMSGGYNPCFSVQHNHGRRDKGQIKKLLTYYERGRGAVYAYMLIHHHKYMLKYLKNK